MAFIKTNFSPIGSNAKRGIAPQRFSYKTADNRFDVDTSGYFNSIYSMLEVGDVIEVSFVDSVTATTAVLDSASFIIASNSGGVVDTYDAQAGRIVLNAHLADISTAGTIYVSSPYAGKLIAVYSAINGAISMSDATLTVKTQEGTAGTITIANAGSAAGDVDTLSPTTNNTITANSTVEIETDGLSTGTVASTISLWISPIGDSN